jgi:dTDP-glucose pyrophosphorylase
MAGAGSRFATAGYPLPKPLIDVEGMPMFVASTNNVIELCKRPPHTLVFVVDEMVNREHGLTDIVKGYYPEAKVVSLSDRTQGAASTVLAALAYLDADRLYSAQKVVVANCDQIVEIPETPSFDRFMQHASAGIVTFKCPERDPKWSYVKVDEYERVLEVAEKNPISDIATVGIYYWAQAHTMVNGIMRMMAMGDRVNGEFYLCPSFNHVIKQSHAVQTFEIDRMHGLGTPEDLERYLCRQKD